MFYSASIRRYKDQFENAQGLICSSKVGPWLYIQHRFSGPPQTLIFLGCNDPKSGHEMRCSATSVMYRIPSMPPKWKMSTHHWKWGHKCSYICFCELRILLGCRHHSFPSRLTASKEWFATFAFVGCKSCTVCFWIITNVEIHSYTTTE